MVNMILVLFFVLALGVVMTCSISYIHRIILARKNAPAIEKLIQKHYQQQNYAPTLFKRGVSFDPQSRQFQLYPAHQLPRTIEEDARFTNQIYSYSDLASCKRIKQRTSNKQISSQQIQLTFHTLYSPVKYIDVTRLSEYEITELLSMFKFIISPSSKQNDIQTYSKPTRSSSSSNTSGDILKQHFEHLENLRFLYSIAHKSNNPFGPNMEKCISLCRQDIALAETVIRELGTDISYPSFKQLCIIYEKRNELDQAIEICQHSISLGLLHDGTEGGMEQRLKRLISKKGVQ